MKHSFKSKYHVLIVILFAMVVIQSIILLYSLDQANSLRQLKTDMQSTIIIFMFIIFIYMIVIYNYIPFRLARALKEIRSLIDDISDGNYDLDIDPSIYDEDSMIRALVLSLKKMLTIIARFDQLKADKIYEHNQRIQLLLNLVPQMAIILSANADAIYINDTFREHFDTIAENVNLNEVIIKDDFISKVLSVMTDALRNGNNIYEAKVQDTESGRTMILNGSIVRTRKGTPGGAVFLMQLHSNDSAHKDTV